MSCSKRTSFIFWMKLSCVSEHNVRWYHAFEDRSTCVENVLSNLSVDVIWLWTHVFLFPGITLPSSFSAFYFLLFIGVCTWWACHFPISHLGFNALCVMVAFFTGGHLVCLYLYQSSFAQEMFSPAGLWARYCCSLLSILFTFAVLYIQYVCDFVALFLLSCYLEGYSDLLK